MEVAPNLAEPQPAFEREKWETELAIKQRELALKEQEQKNRDLEVEFKRQEQSTSKWSNPLVVAIFAASIAGIGNAVVTVVNGKLQRAIETERSRSTQNLEESKAESGRILEMIKTGDPEKAATNLAFLVETGLIANPDLVAQVRSYLAARKSGAGPSLPAAAPSTSGDRYEFRPTASLTTSVVSALESSLHDYAAFLDSLGFPKTKDKIKIVIEDIGDLQAHYDKPNRTIEIDTPIAGDIDIPRFIFTDSIISESNTEVNVGYDGLSIEYAISFYFPCSFANRPTLASFTAAVRKLKTPFVRNLENNRPFTLIGSIHNNEEALLAGEIWGGAFWEVRNLIGQHLADQILAVAWRSMPRPTSMQDAHSKFIETLLSAAKSSASDGEQKKLRAALYRRGFPIEP